MGIYHVPDTLHVFVSVYFILIQTFELKNITPLAALVLIGRGKAKS